MALETTVSRGFQSLVWTASSLGSDIS